MISHSTKQKKKKRIFASQKVSLLFRINLQQSKIYSFYAIFFFISLKFIAFILFLPINLFTIQQRNKTITVLRLIPNSAKQ